MVVQGRPLGNCGRRPRRCGPGPRRPSQQPGRGRPDWLAGVKQTIAWFRANRAKLKKGTVANLNVPSCSKGKVRGTTTVTKTSETFYDFDAFGTADCAVKAKPLENDVTAYFAGFAPLQSIGLGN